MFVLFFYLSWRHARMEKLPWQDRHPQPTYLADVVELVPVLVVHHDVAVERLEFGPARDGQVEGLGREERLLI